MKKHVFLLLFILIVLKANAQETSALYNLEPTYQDEKKVYQLTISGDDIASILDDLSGFSNLETLEISTSNHLNLPKSICDLKNLKTLIINQTAIETVPECFKNLSSLNYLHLDNTGLVVIPEFIYELIQLKELKITFNEITSIDKKIKNLKNLEVLDLGGNSISILPTEMNTLKNLKEFSIYKNHLKDFPKEILTLNSLEKLDLSENKIQSISPKEIVFTKLKVLNFSKNNLTTFPEFVSSLTQLNYLDLSYNYLEQLPETITTLKYLKDLNLDHNYLRKLPSNIGGLIQLEALSVSNNNLQNLPENIGKLQNLSYLNTEDNPKLVSLPENIFELIAYSLDSIFVDKHLKTQKAEYITKRKKIEYSEDYLDFKISNYSIILKQECLDGNCEIKGIQVTNTKDNLIQHINVKVNNFDKNFQPNMLFILEDMNFDGFIDFRLLQHLPANGNQAYYYWLYNPKTNQFEPNTYFESLLSPTFNPETRSITSSYRFKLVENVIETYSLQNNELVLITRVIKKN